MIENPILRGFNPDPSICRVGDDYYIATSTFEWFPGVQIHHSRDLKNWELISRPLNRRSQLNMLGVPDSCGVWAPCLSFSEGVFYLVYTNVKSFDGVWKDTPNYLVTAEEIEGEWSDPIYLSSRGFDGSFFHDDDGSKWFLSMLIDHRKGKFFGGIEMQAYDPSKKTLKGEVHYLTEGSDLGLSEAPHLYKKNGYYYLLLAEGGTEYGHAVSIARSKNILGPYTFHPENPILTANRHPENVLQKAGHGDLFQVQNGDWYIVFLVGRPLTTQGLCTLGRETAIEEIEWKNDWPYLKNTSSAPRLKIPQPDLPEYSFSSPSSLVSFKDGVLPIDFQALRIPVSQDWCNFKDRKGYLRLYGKESLNSLHRQSLLARRIQAFHVEASLAVEFEPSNILQMAGMVFYYNTGHYHYACIRGDAKGDKKYLCVYSSDNYNMTFQEEIAEVSAHKTVYIKGIMKAEELQFYYSIDGKNFRILGHSLDASILSDDYVREGSERYRPAFTGSFIGICCQDLSLNQNHADFEWFKYEEKMQ